MDKYKRGIKCFSPEVMLATFVIEIVLAVYTFIRYKLTMVARLVMVLLVLLAVFQAAEYNVCAAALIDPMWAARIGYVAITLLPPVGIHLAYTIAGAKRRPWLLPGYMFGAIFVAFFLFIGNALTGHACQGNYVIFDMAPGSQWFYTAYYYGFLAVGIWVCAKLAEFNKQPKIRRALKALMLGYLAFVVPTTAANVINPETIAGIPSIMCGFAILLAIALTCWVLPLTAPTLTRK